MLKTNDKKRILAIGSHFDDVELGCGGTLLKHKQSGDELHILIITHSGYKSPGKAANRERAIALQEGEKSAEYLGAQLTCLDMEPTLLVPTESLILEIEYEVNRIVPDIVYTHQLNDSNADHAAVGYMSMRACRKCDEVYLYRSNWYIMDDTKIDNYYVDISTYIKEKETLLRYFESEMKQVDYSWIDFVKRQNHAAGAKVGVDYAETFHVMKKFWR